MSHSPKSIPFLLLLVIVEKLFFFEILYGGSVIIWSTFILLFINSCSKSYESPQYILYFSVTSLLLVYDSLIAFPIAFANNGGTALPICLQTAVLGP